MQFTAVYVEGNGFIVVYVEEFRDIVTQGKTMEQARRRVTEAVQLLLEIAREELQECTFERRILLRETITIPSDKVDA